MKKIFFILWVLLMGYPFLNSLLFSTPTQMKTTFIGNDNKTHHINAFLNGMHFYAYHRLSDGYGNITRGIYGLVNDTYYFIYLENHYSVAKGKKVGEEEKDRFKSIISEGFLNKHSWIAVVKVKKITKESAIIRYSFPLQENSSDYYNYKKISIEPID